MENTKPTRINWIRYLAASYFTTIAIINIVDAFTHRRAGAFDITFLAVTCLPLLINNRYFILGYGTIAFLISLPIVLVYLISAKVDYLLSYLLGIGVFVLAIVCSLALVYVGTYSKEKGRFKLV